MDIHGPVPTFSGNPFNDFFLIVIVFRKMG